MQIMFPNFVVLGNILSQLHQKTQYQNIESLINNYLSSIPSFYFKLVQHFFLTLFSIKIKSPIGNSAVQNVQSMF